LNVSEFLKLNENIGHFRGLNDCLGYGIMEWWNTGRLVFKRILSIPLIDEFLQ
jgi:hypothetical protein